MVVHNDHIEFELGLLRQRAVNCVTNRALPISNRNYNARLHGEFLIVRRARLESRWQKCAYSSEMLCCDPLHLNLILTLGWIDIVELLFTACSEIHRYSTVEWLCDARKNRIDRQLEP